MRMAMPSATINTIPIKTVNSVITYSPVSGRNTSNSGTPPTNNNEPISNPARAISRFSG